MGLPIVSEIFDGLRWIVDFFINKIPKPLKVLIFLLFLLLFSSLITFMLHFSGIHCNSDKLVVRTSPLDIGTNVALIWETQERIFSEQTLSICDAHPDKCGVENECYFYAQKLDNGLYSECNSTNATSECGYYLKDGNCHTCNAEEICFQESMNWIFCGDWHDVCLENAYPSEYDTTFDHFSGCGSSCYVPDNYLWNVSTGQYECADETYCGENPTIVADPVIDEKLMRAGAKLVYPITTNEKSYTRMVYLKCDSEFNPRLTFYGIDILDYKMWVFLIVIYILAILLFKMKGNG